MTSPPPSWGYGDFETGQVFTTQRRTITEADLVMFAGWSWDTNPVHTDSVGQADSRFGQRIAHGALGLAVALGLVSNLGVFEDCAVALLGIDGWRFQSPILVGDTVHAEVHIVGKRITSSGDTGVLQREFRVLNQSGATVQEGRLDLLIRANQASGSR